jgi:hypothetical protein
LSTGIAFDFRLSLGDRDVSAASVGADVLSQMDEAAISRVHWRIMFISGMGFFTTLMTSSSSAS